MYEEKKENYWMIVAIVQWIVICLMMALFYPSMDYMREQMNDIRSSMSSSQKNTSSMQEEIRQFMNDNKEWQQSMERRLKKGLENGEW